MGLKNSSILTGAAISTTGGSPLTLVDDGVSVANGFHLAFLEDPDYQTRRQVVIKHRPPTLDPKTQTYGKDKKSITIVNPVEKDGRMYFETLRIEREVLPSSTADANANLNTMGAQLLTAASAEDFWRVGSHT